MPTVMHSFARSVVLGVLSLTFNQWCPYSKAAEEIIVDNTRSASELMHKIDGPVFAFRNLTNTPFSETGTGPIEIPRDVVVKSVLSFDEIHEAFHKRRFGPKHGNN